MAQRQDQLARTISRVAMVIAAIVALSLPGGYFGLSYQYQIGAMQSEAEFNAQRATRYVALNPEMWRFQEHRLQELVVDDHAMIDFPQRQRIVDEANQVIAASDKKLDAPVLSIRAPLFDAGKRVGYFEISRSLRPLLLKTSLVALLALGLAIAVFSLLKLLPLRALNR